MKRFKQNNFAGRGVIVRRDAILRRLLMFLIVLSAAFAFGVACTSFKKMTMIMGSDPIADPAAAAARGKAIYNQHCVACHGDSGRGAGPGVTEANVAPADLPELAARKSVKTFAANITYGKNGMPAFRGQLSEEQIWDVAHYVKAFAR